MVAAAALILITPELATAPVPNGVLVVAAGFTFTVTPLAIVMAPELVLLPVKVMEPALLLLPKLSAVEPLMFPERVKASPVVATIVAPFVLKANALTRLTVEALPIIVVPASEAEPVPNALFALITTVPAPKVVPPE